MPTKSRLSFPTKFAREQNYYEVKDGTKMYIFDQITQFIYKVSFKLGQVAGDGLDEYVFKSYSSVEKKFFLSNYDILFARRTYREVGAPADVDYLCQVNAAPTKFISTVPKVYDYTGAKIVQNRRISEDYESYTFLNDQLVYDPQLVHLAFRGKKEFDILGTTSMDAHGNFPSYLVGPTDTGSMTATDAQNQAKVERFIPYNDQKVIADDIMKDKAWIRRFAQKHFLFIFRSNNVNPSPRILYGFPVKDLRIHPYDQVKY